MPYDDPEGDPGRHVRDRVYGDVRRDTNRGGRVALASSLIALCSFLLIWALSAYQVTEPGRSSLIIERGVASVVDIDRYLPEVLPELRSQAEANPAAVYELPGYPLPVAVSGEELTARSDTEMRTIVLRRSSALVYADGLDAFDMAEGQSFPLLSAENAVESFVSLLRGSFHDRVGVAAVIFAIIITLAGGVAAASDRRPGVLRTIGGALLAGALAGLVLSVALVVLVGRTGGDDVFTSEMASIAESIAEVPRRNFFIATVFAAMLFFGGIGLSILEKRYFRDRAAEPNPGEWYDYDTGGRRPVFIESGNAYDSMPYDDTSAEYDDGYADIPGDADGHPIGSWEEEEEEIGRHPRD